VVENLYNKILKEFEKRTGVIQFYFNVL
jgi:hypothetical protein